MSPLPLPPMWAIPFLSTVKAPDPNLISGVAKSIIIPRPLGPSL